MATRIDINTTGINSAYDYFKSIAVGKLWPLRLKDTLWALVNGHNEFVALQEQLKQRPF